MLFLGGRIRGRSICTGTHTVRPRLVRLAADCGYQRLYTRDLILKRFNFFPTPFTEQTKKPRSATTSRATALAMIIIILLLFRKPARRAPPCPLGLPAPYRILSSYHREGSAPVGSGFSWDFLNSFNSRSFSFKSPFSLSTSRSSFFLSSAQRSLHCCMSFWASA